MGNAHACPRCGDSRKVWTGAEWRPCLRCSPGLRGQRIPDPVRDRYHLVSVEDWPAVRARLLEMKAAAT
jgi:methylphosphotriester-DNA--protein-cysteine methyltransferase